MDLHLNDDVQEDERMEAPPAHPPPFALPSSRGTSGVSMRSLLSSDSPRTPQADVASIVAPISSQPVFTAARTGGLSSLMNSPMQEDTHRHAVHNLMNASTPTTENQGNQPIQQHLEAMDADPDVDMEDADGSKRRRRLSSIASNDSGASASLDAAVSPRSPSTAAVHVVDSLDLADPELAMRQKDLQDCVQGYLVAVAKVAAGAAPPVKRARKGRQQKKRAQQQQQQQQPDAVAAAEVATQLQHVERSVRELQSKILADGLCHPHPEDALQDSVRLCLSFLRAIPDPSRSSSDSSVRHSLQSLREALATALTRAVFGRNDPTTTHRLLQAVYAWWMQQQRPQEGEEASADAPVCTWLWLWLHLARLDAWTVLAFLLARASRPDDSDRPDDQRRRLVVVVDTLVADLGHTSVAHIVHLLLEQLATGPPSAESSTAPAAPPSRDWVVSAFSVLLPSASPDEVLKTVLGVVAVITESTTLVPALDASLSRLLDPALVIALWRRIEAAAGAPGTLREGLLTLLRRRMGDARHGATELLRLLHALMDDGGNAATPSALVAHATEFHAALLQYVTTAGPADASAQRVVQELAHRLPSIAQTTVEHPAAARRWAPWLALLARQFSRRDVFARLVDADLMLAETTRHGSSDDTTALCTLLLSLADADSGSTGHGPTASRASRLSELLRHLVSCCQRTTSRRSQSRLLAVLRDVLIRANSSESFSTTADSGLTVAVSESALASPDTLVAALTAQRPWRDSWDDLHAQRGASGASSCWSFALHLLTQRGVSSRISRRALDVLRIAPVPTLEDPMWQFQCVRQLTAAFFLVLRRFRVALVYGDERDASATASASASAQLATQLDTLRVILVRVLATEGGIARYAASLWTQFVVLWMDEMWSSSSATSVPTHFPNPLQHQQQWASSAEQDQDEEADEAREPGDDERDDVVTIRSERTISSKCTNLQSSQVITKRTSELLVYRKALDETWARELHAAQRCSALAMDVLASLVDTTASLGLADGDGDDGPQRERRLRVLVDVLLERALPCCGIPSDDAYKEVLPNRSNVDMDLRIEQWLNHFPAFLPLLRLILKTSLAGASGAPSAQALRVLPLLKSALVVLLGHWNSVKGDLDVENMDIPPYMRNQNQLALSCELVEILRLSGWLPAPLARTAELLPLTTPADIRGILFSCWFFLADHPPSATDAASNGKSMPIEFYVLPIRRALHQNIHKVGAKYPLFMC
ncbi:hypothetical protein ATCC90586_008749 [Pythium insidiosum]|nr:hypothetical protein ATCC90586_008749 [Pythium insidiosum]